MTESEIRILPPENSIEEKCPSSLCQLSLSASYTQVAPFRTDRLKVDLPKNPTEEDVKKALGLDEDSEECDCGCEEHDDACKTEKKSAKSAKKAEPAKKASAAKKAEPAKKAEAKKSASAKKSATKKSAK